MPVIRLDLTKLPPSARRQSISVLRKPEVIANFVRRNHWTDTCNGVAPELPTKALVRIFEQSRSNGEATIASYGVVLLPNKKTAHRVLIVHCSSSELEQTREGLETITASYLWQLVGLEIAASNHLTELSDSEGK